jgi:hypothetical protein
VAAPTRIGLVALFLFSACDDAQRAPTAEAVERSGDATSPVTARGVELRVPQPGGGDVVIAGDAFTLGPNRSASLTGDVRLRSEGGMRFEASAARAALEGGVHAVLTIGRVSGDAGAADD